MRYYFFGGWCCSGAFSGAGTESSLALGSVTLAVEGFAIDPVGAKQGALALLIGAAVKAVGVTEITGAAKHNQLVAAGTTVEAGGGFHDTVSEPKQWTVSASTTILSPPTVQYVGLAAPG